MKQFIKKNWNAIENGLLILLCVYLLIELGGKGFLYWIAAIILVGLVRLFRYREYFKYALLYPIQKIIWGKPLVKELWKEGEWKNERNKPIKKAWKAVRSNAFRKRKADSKGSFTGKPLRTNSCAKKNAKGVQQNVYKVQEKND